MPAPLTRTLAEFSVGLTYDALPKAAVEAVVTGFTDTVGVMYSGRSFPVAKFAYELSDTRGLKKDSRLYLSEERASATEAALINSAAAGGGVFDDVAFAGCHTSVVMIPALLAEADVIGASGRDVIRAYAAGYEMWARLSERDKDAYSSKGWHATATFGPVAGATALANLRKFDAQQTARAIGIAAAMSGGIIHSFDHPVGAYQVARASAAAVSAVRLAAAGMSAAEDTLERPGRGLLNALSPKGNVDFDTPIEDLGKAWRLESVGIHVKQHPCGNMMQRALDGVLDIVRKHDVKPFDIERIEALISMAQYEVHKKSPSTSTTHIVPSHSIELALTAAAIDRKLTYDHLTHAFLARPEIKDLMGRIVVTPDESIPADTTPNLGFSGGIRMRLKDGRTLESPSVSFARGHWTRRLSQDELWGKFAQCSSAHLTPIAARALFDQLQNLDQVASIGDLNRAK